MNNMPNNNPNFPNFQALLDYIKATPAWLLGFVDGFFKCLLILLLCTNFYTVSYCDCTEIVVWGANLTSSVGLPHSASLM
jgi:hypothetical protein